MGLMTLSEQDYDGGERQPASPTYTTQPHQMIQLQPINSKTIDYISFLYELRSSGRGLRSDLDQPNLTEKPEWLDEAKFKNAQSVYRRHFMGVNFAHLSGLLLLVRVESIFRTLDVTGQSDTVAKLFKRYYHTLIHVKKWYEGDIFEKHSDAYKSLLIVRGMHNRVSTKYNDDINHNEVTVTGNSCGKLLHVSEYDIMLTQFAFIGLIVIKADHVGLLDDFSAHDLDSLVHFWRVIGYYLGVSDRFNLCHYNREDVEGLCKAIMEVEFKESINKNPLDTPPGIMSVNIIRSLKFIPMLTIYGMLNYLYEILGAETSGIEHKKNWYSTLSYKLITLVMTRLLAYKPLRSFNNGLTRLSVHLTGNVEKWFASHLESKYGDDMRI